MSGSCVTYEAKRPRGQYLPLGVSIQQLSIALGSPQWMQAIPATRIDPSLAIER
jgi:hypothetical protein